MSRCRRVLAAAGVALLTTTANVSPAEADVIVQTVQCVQPSTGEQINAISNAQRRMAFTDAWPISRGAGVRVAVIDTGVTPHPLLDNRLIGGADLVVPADGSKVDCDGHGTLVAGLIAAQFDPSSGFAGVAPEATIVSIRQASSRYVVQADDRSERPVGDVTTLAAAIDDAVSAGVSVINISQTGCVVAGSANDQALAAALAAAAGADIVVVAAAGNLGETCTTQNEPGRSPVTIPLPANFDSVLSVAAVDQNGAAAGFSLAGPWVDLAAPGTDIVSLDPAVSATGLVNQVATENSLTPINGTSFAAPYVTGVVALVRAAYPELSAPQVVRRILETAQHPPTASGRNDYVGYGTVNALSAVTAVLPADPPSAPRSQAAIPELIKPVPPDNTPRNIALLVSGLAIATLVVGAAAIITVRRAYRLSRGKQLATPRR